MAQLANPVYYPNYNSLPVINNQLPVVNNSYTLSPVAEPINTISYNDGSIIQSNSPMISMADAQPLDYSEVIIPEEIPNNSVLPNNVLTNFNNGITTNQRILKPTQYVQQNNIQRLPNTSIDLVNGELQSKDYQGLINNSSLESELLNYEYKPLSKIVVKTDNGDRRTQYIKAINKNGQKVFIMIDVNGYTTVRPNDLTLIETHNASIIPLSLKQGAYKCAENNVSGIAFECGGDAVCVVSQNPDDLQPKEATFIFAEQNTPTVATVQSEGSIMTYPVIRMSEIRANKLLVLENTDIVTRNLRNKTYISLVNELAIFDKSIGRLSATFNSFNKLRDEVAVKLNKTLTQLEHYNRAYITNPPLSEECRIRYRQLQFNLAQRNEGIETLLRSIKKVTDKHVELDKITKEINDIIEYDRREFANVEFVNFD